ncbi:MAG: release factor glutamine methyltransferase [Acidobacteriaceae bacterium]|jgi:release factor glutamine methyltransferase|nr:release factor glutamine methyltransferase [Acidobacteriaceae bacterium]
MTTLHAALHEGAIGLAPSNTARRDAELLLLHATGLTRAEFMTHPDRELTEAQTSTYRAAIARRARKEPVQYITGTQEFYGRPFIVTPAVLIPRPETEHLVEAVLALHPAPRRILPLRILDIGTGSGILAVTLALELANATVTATDVSSATLDVAERNAAALGATDRIRFVESDLFAAIPPNSNARFDCIVSNPPYVPSTELLEPQVRDYEPASALYAGDDGLAIYRRLIPGAAAHLEPGGHLLVEIGHGQRDAIGELLRASGFESIRFTDDLQGIPRVAIAKSALA